MNQDKPNLATANYLGKMWDATGARVHLTLDDRRRHVLITGAPGTGKSTLLANLFAQEANNGRGVLLLDAHGDLAEQVISLVPPRRRRKTIYFNAADPEFPIGFNVLANVPSDQWATRVADIMEAIRSIWADSWGPRLNHILLFTLSALIELGDATLLSISPMLLNPEFRKRVLARVRDPKTIEFWNTTFPLYAEQGPEVFTPILNKIDAILASPRLRNILGNPRSAFDPRYLIDNKYIIVANLSGIGAEPANLLGSLLISSFAAAAKSRENIRPNHRVPFSMMIDEFTTYSTSEFKSLLSEARKANVSLVLAHQYLDQISDHEIRSAALGAVGSYIVFRVSGADAHKFNQGPMPDFPAESYVDTPNFRAWCRLLQYGNPTQAFQLYLHKSPKPQRMRQATILHSRHQWATPRAKIEEHIMRFLNPKLAAEKPLLSGRSWGRRRA